MLVALERGADEIVILERSGGARIDHALANIGLLAHPALAGRRALLLDAVARGLVRRPGPTGRRWSGRCPEMSATWSAGCRSETASRGAPPAAWRTP